MCIETLAGKNMCLSVMFERYELFRSFLSVQWLKFDDDIVSKVCTVLYMYMCMLTTQ